MTLESEVETRRSDTAAWVSEQLRLMGQYLFLSSMRQTDDVGFGDTSV